EISAAAAITDCEITREGGLAVIVTKHPGGGHLIEVWDLESGEKRFSPSSAGGTFGSMAIAGDDRYLMYSSSSFDNYLDAYLQWLNLHTGESVWFNQNNSGYWALFPLPDGRLACGLGESGLQVWNVAN